MKKKPTNLNITPNAPKKKSATGPTRPTRPTWKVSGSNWVWQKKAPANSCPMEMATQALEKIWSRKPEDQKRIKKCLQSPTQAPSLGLTILVSHSKMKTKSEHILICSVTALANAGHYNEAKRLHNLSQSD